MNTIDEIYNAYIEAEAIYRKTNEKICEKELSILRLEKQIRNLNKKISKIYWVDNIAKPLAEVLTPLLECEDYKIYGPFGLRAEITIFFRKSETPKKDSDYSLSLTVRFDYNDDSNYKGRYCSASVKSVGLYYNTGKKAFNYPEGSIGALNGMDYIEEPLPVEIDKIIKIIKEKSLQWKTPKN